MSLVISCHSMDERRAIPLHPVVVSISASIVIPGFPQEAAESRNPEMLSKCIMYSAHRNSPDKAPDFQWNDVAPAVVDTNNDLLPIAVLIFIDKSPPPFC
ncbi:hypothetical protein LXL04_025224 [Taraxacum kok-saghyz]